MMKKKALSDKYPIGQLVRSRQGRDQNRLYIVTAVEDRNLDAADGTKWTVSKPKRKNPLHLQKINIPYGCRDYRCRYSKNYSNL